MPGRSADPKLPPQVRTILTLLENCRDVAFHQKLTEARDVLQATRIAARGFGLDIEDILDELDSSIVSKPVYSMWAAFDSGMGALYERAITTEQEKCRKRPPKLGL